MGKKELVANRQYTDEFKVEAVKLGESIGGNQAAKRLGIPESSLWNWVRLSRAGKLKAAAGSAVAAKRSVSEAENARLRRVTLPWFRVHQIACKFLMNGGRY